MRYTLLILIAVAALTINVSNSFAQESRHPDATAFDPYVGLKDNEGNACCHGIHCRPALYQQRDREHWMSTDNGATWFQVPAEKEVLPTPSVEKLGGATWCGTISDTRGTKCWVRPQQKPSV